MPLSGASAAYIGARGGAAGIATAASFGGVLEASRAMGARFDRSVAWIYEPPTALGQKVVMVLGSVFRVLAGETAYIGTGYAGDEQDVWIPVPAGTALELHVGVDEDAGAGSYAATLRKQGADTALAVSLTGTTRKASIAGSVVFAAGDWLSVKVVASGGAPDAHVNVSVKYQFAT